MSSNKTQNQTPYLAIEERPNSFIAIDLNNLDIFTNGNSQVMYNDINELDFILGNFQESQIRESLKRSNTIDQDKCDSPFVIIYRGHSLPIITKDNSDKLSVLEIFEKAVLDKQEANKYFNIYRKVVKKYFGDDENYISMIFEKLKFALSNNDKDILISTFGSLPYLAQRELVFYYYDLENKSKLENSQKLLREKTE